MGIRILRDHTDSSGVHSQALDSLQAKLSEVEAALRREQDSLKQVQVLYYLSIQCTGVFHFPDKQTFENMNQ